MAKIDGASELVPRPQVGRAFSTRRRVRLSDTTADGMLRLDALARYVQDIASDDARATMPDSYLAWVVRRTMLEVERHPVAEEEVELTTWCSGYGGRWAERRTSVVGDAGGVGEVVMLWVAIDARTEAPVRLPADFHAAYDEASGGRKVSARLTHGEPPTHAPAAPWRFRAGDLDRLGHVNNAAYWVVVEELLHGQTRPHTLRAELEYRAAVPPSHPLRVVTDVQPHETRLWLVDDAPDPATRASMRLNLGA